MAFRFEQTISPDHPEWINKVLEARKMTIGEKFCAGPRLFDIRCQEARQLIRTQFPEFNDEQVEEELKRWLAKEREEDEAGIYRNLGEFDIDLSDEELFKLIENSSLPDAE